MNNLLVLFVLIVPPLLFAITCLIDNNLVKDYSPGPLMAIGGVFNLVVATGLIIWTWIGGIEISFSTGFLFLMVNGLSYMVAMWLYLDIIKKEEVSRAVPFFQSIPVYGLIGGYFFLGERLDWLHILAISFMAVGGLVLVVKDGVVRKKMAFAMLLSSALLAINDVVFANFGREMKVLPALLADLLGKACWGFMVLVRREYRIEFLRGFKQKFKLQAANELLFILADLIFDWAKIIAPVAIAQGMCATQPLFLLGLTVLATKFFPKFHSEDLSGIAKWQKWCGASLMVFGGIIVSI